MGQVLQTDEVRVEWADIDARTNAHISTDPESPRSSGIHLSGVLRYIATTSGILKNVDSTTGKWKGDTTLDEEEMPLRMALGMAWEQWVVGLYPEMSWQPGEMESDGVKGTPDGISILSTFPQREYLIIVEEFKVTWKSEHKLDILQQWMWNHQGMGYAHMLGTRFVRYHIMFVNGDYRPPAPKYMRYLVEYSEVEIERAWQLVLRNKDNKGVNHESH